MTQAAQLAQYGSNAVGLSFKSRIINGAMRIDQRNAGAAVTNSTGIIYTLDRWIVQTVGSSCVVQQVTGSTGNNKALRITGASGNTNTLLSQKIEASNIYDAASQTVTVSFTLYGSSSGSVSVRFLYPTATDNFSSTTEPLAGTTVNFTTTATTYTVTRTLDANANKGLWVVFERGATGAGVTWSVENVQLEKGSTATSFDYRPYGTELALCQRYYQNLYFENAIAARPSAEGSGAMQVNLPYLVSVRALPTIAFPSYGWGSASGGTATAHTSGSYGINSVRVYGTSAVSAGYVAQLTCNMTVSAEL